jgi:hypothetical protein
MKRTIFYLAPLLLILLIIVSCSKTPKAIDYQAPDLTGSYTGSFTRIHEALATGKLDTASVNIILTLGTGGTFNVVGDTATVHAGSKGTYSLGYQDDLFFTDKTFPSTGNSVKTHLNGDYAYTYNSGLFTLGRTEGDSVIYQYKLTKN